MKLPPCGEFQSCMNLVMYQNLVSLNGGIKGNDSRLRLPSPLPRIPRCSLRSPIFFLFDPVFLPFSPTAKPGPRLLCIVGSVSVACWFFCQYFLCIVVMFLQHISFCKCQVRVYFPWQKIEPFEGDICLRLKNWFCSCAV